MSWLIKSSIGRKFVMAFSGLCLVLFLLFHMSMNLVSIFSIEWYEVICEFLGINWYALVGTIFLGAFFIIHIVYAIILTHKNLKARGKVGYERRMSGDAPWSSKNMLALGIVLLAFILFHLWDFWFRMMFAELFGLDFAVHPSEIGPWMLAIFGNVVRLIIYIVGIIALWLHLTHGIWSMFHSVGFDGRNWILRLKWIGYVFASIICIGFLIVPVIFFARAAMLGC